MPSSKSGSHYQVAVIGAGASGYTSPNLYTIGPLRIAGLWESIAIPEIRNQAMDVVELRISSPVLPSPLRSSSAALAFTCFITGRFGFAPGLLADLGPTRPDAFTLVYFTTPTCVPCKTVQRPAIQNLSQMLGNTLQVVEIDATERPDLASRWGVMSVPTTFVIDPGGKLRHVNHGVTRAEQLLTQLHGVE